MRTMQECSLAGRLCARGTLISVLLVAQAHAASIPDAPTLSPSSLPKIGTVDERFQSYNIEMVEVTGGRFWKPYDQQVDAILAAQAAGQKTGTGKPTGMDPALYQYRTPINLSNPRLRKLA